MHNGEQGQNKYCTVFYRENRKMGNTKTSVALRVTEPWKVIVRNFAMALKTDPQFDHGKLPRDPPLLIVFSGSDFVLWQILTCLLSSVWVLWSLPTL